VLGAVVVVVVGAVVVVVAGVVVVVVPLVVDAVKTALTGPRLLKPSVAVTRKL
jgi:hypothetical protein